jgi:hypothetical protein
MMRKREDTRERALVVVWLRCNPDTRLRGTAGIRSFPWQASNFASLQSSAICSTWLKAMVLLSLGRANACLASCESGDVISLCGKIRDDLSSNLLTCTGKASV